MVEIFILLASGKWIFIITLVYFEKGPIYHDMHKCTNWQIVLKLQVVMDPELNL